MSEMNDSGGGEAAEASRGSAGGETAAEPGQGEPAGAPASDGYYIGGPEVEEDIAKIKEQQAGTEVANSGGSGEAGATSGAKAGGDSGASGDGKASARQDAGAESTVEASRGSAGGETAAEPGQGEPAGAPASDGYYIGGPEVEEDIAKIKEQQAGTEVANSGGSGEAGATSGAKAGGDSGASGDGKASARQDAGAESTAEASRGSAGGETAAEPGQGEPAGAPASDGYYIGGPEVEEDIAKIKEQQAAGGRDNGNGNRSNRPSEPPNAEEAWDQPGEAQDFGTRIQNGLKTRLNDPNTREQFPDGYDPFHGDTPEQYLNKYASGVDADGKPNWNWPNNGGAVEGTESPRQLQPGVILDRYGPDQGKFLCLSGTSYQERSLPADRLASEYHQYRVIRPLPANEAEIAPAFGEPGAGIQFRTDQSVRQLISDGYLEEVRL